MVARARLARAALLLAIAAAPVSPVVASDAPPAAGADAQRLAAAVALLVAEPEISVAYTVVGLEG